MALNKWVIGKKMSEQLSDQNKNFDEIDKDIKGLEKFTLSPTLPQGTDFLTLTETGIYSISGKYVNGNVTGNFYGNLIALKMGVRGNMTFIITGLDASLYVGSKLDGKIKWKKYA